MTHSRAVGAALAGPEGRRANRSEAFDEILKALVASSHRRVVASSQQAVSACSRLFL